MVSSEEKVKPGARRYTCLFTTCLVVKRGKGVEYLWLFKRSGLGSRQLEMEQGERIGNHLK